MTPTTKTGTALPTAAARTLLPRRTIGLGHGEVAYVDHGGGGGADGAAAAPAALFVHGVLVNADLWRNVIWDVADVRRCIAPDLPAHGATAVPAGDAADLSLNGLAAMLHDLCGALGLDRVDVIANDTGGAVAQVFAARYPQRVRTLTLTNCDVHDNFPPRPSSPSSRWPSRANSARWSPPWPATSRWPVPRSGSHRAMRTPTGSPTSSS